jgi:hypothetical protein
MQPYQVTPTQLRQQLLTPDTSIQLTLVALITRSTRVRQSQMTAPDKLVATPQALRLQQVLVQRVAPLQTQTYPRTTPLLTL